MAWQTFVVNKTLSDVSKCLPSQSVQTDKVSVCFTKCTTITAEKKITTAYCTVTLYESTESYKTYIKYYSISTVQKLLLVHYAYSHVHCPPALSSPYNCVNCLCNDSTKTISCVLIMFVNLSCSTNQVTLIVSVKTRDVSVHFELS